MEILGIIFLALIVLVILKMAGVLIHSGLFILALPFKILGLVIFTILLAPLAILLVPISLIALFSPFILVVIGLVLLLKR